MSHIKKYIASFYKDSNNLVGSITVGKHFHVLSFGGE